MARRTKAASTEVSEVETTEIAPRDSNTALEPWEEKLLAEAQAQKETVADIGGGLFASIRGGKITIGDNVVGKEMACIILANCAGKAYYKNGFNPGQAESPECYAFGAALKGLSPHEQSPEKKCDECDKCKYNEFGSAKTGNGKACKDSIRLIFIEGGSLGKNGVFIPYGNKAPDLAKLAKNDAVKLSIPPTSLASFAKYVRAMSEANSRPLFAVHTLIKVDMVSKNGADYPEVKFECLGLASKEQIGTLRDRAAACAPELSQPYPKLGKKDTEAEEESATKPSAKTTKTSKKY